MAKWAERFRFDEEAREWLLDAAEAGIGSEDQVEHFIAVTEELVSELLLVRESEEELKSGLAEAREIGDAAARLGAQLENLGEGARRWIMTRGPSDSMDSTGLQQLCRQLRAVGDHFSAVLPAPKAHAPKQIGPEVLFVQCLAQEWEAVFAATPTIGGYFREFVERSLEGVGIRRDVRYLLRSTLRKTSA